MTGEYINSDGNFEYSYKDYSDYQSTFQNKLNALIKVDGLDEIISKDQLATDDANTSYLPYDVEVVGLKSGSVKVGTKYELSIDKYSSSFYDTGLSYYVRPARSGDEGYKPSYLIFTGNKISYYFRNFVTVDADGNVKSFGSSQTFGRRSLETFGLFKINIGAKNFAYENFESSNSNYYRFPAVGYRIYADIEYTEGEKKGLKEEGVLIGDAIVYSSNDDDDYQDIPLNITDYGKYSNIRAEVYNSGEIKDYYDIESGVAELKIPNFTVEKDTSRVSGVYSLVIDSSYNGRVYDVDTAPAAADLGLTINGYGQDEESWRIDYTKPIKYKYSNGTYDTLYDSFGDLIASKQKGKSYAISSCYAYPYVCVVNDVTKEEEYKKVIYYGDYSRNYDCYFLGSTKEMPISFSYIEESKIATVTADTRKDNPQSGDMKLYVLIDGDKKLIGEATSWTYGAKLEVNMNDYKYGKKGNEYSFLVEYTRADTSAYYNSTLTPEEKYIGVNEEEANYDEVTVTEQEYESNFTHVKYTYDADTKELTIEGLDEEPSNLIEDNVKFWKNYELKKINFKNIKGIYTTYFKGLSIGSFTYDDKLEKVNSSTFKGTRFLDEVTIDGDDIDYSSTGIFKEAIFEENVTIKGRMFSNNTFNGASFNKTLTLTGGFDASQVESYSEYIFKDAKIKRLVIEDVKDDETTENAGLGVVSKEIYQLPTEELVLKGAFKINDDTNYYTLKCSKLTIIDTSAEGMKLPASFISSAPSNVQVYISGSMKDFTNTAFPDSAIVHVSSNVSGLKFAGNNKYILEGSINFTDYENNGAFVCYIGDFIQGTDSLNVYHLKWIDNSDATACCIDVYANCYESQSDTYSGEKAGLYYTKTFGKAYPKYYATASKHVFTTKSTCDLCGTKATITGVEVKNNARDYDGTAVSFVPVTNIPDEYLDKITIDTGDLDLINAGVRDGQVKFTFKDVEYSKPITIQIRPKLLTKIVVEADDKNYDGTQTVNNPRVSFPEVPGGEVEGLEVSVAYNSNYVGTTRGKATLRVTGDSVNYIMVDQKYLTNNGFYNFAFANTYFLVGATNEIDIQLPAIKKQLRTVSVDMPDYYLGQSHKYTVTQSPNVNDPTILYKGADEADTEYTATEPTKVGKYIIKAIFPETDTYAEVECYDEFEITKGQYPDVRYSNFKHVYGEEFKGVITYNGGELPEGTEVYFKLQTASDDAYSEEVPVDAGTYRIKVVLPETEQYLAKTYANTNFTISKAEGEGEVSVEDIKVGGELKVKYLSVTNGVDSETGDGSATIKYAEYKNGVPAGPDYKADLTETVPTAAGHYVVRAEFSETNNYKSVYAYSDFFITDKDIVKAAVEVTNTEYNAEGGIKLNITTERTDTPNIYYYPASNPLAITKDAPTEVGSYVVVVNYSESESYSAFEVAKAFDITPIEGEAECEGVNRYYDEGSKLMYTYSSDNYCAYSDESKESKGNVTVLYKEKDAADTEYSAKYPWNIGKYNIKLIFDAYGNYARKEVVLEAEILPSVGMGTVDLADWNYGEAAKTPVLSSSTNKGKVTITYAVRGTENFTSEVPTKVGKYTVKAVFEAYGNYSEVVATDNFEILGNKGTGEVSISGWTYGDKPNAPVYKSETNAVDSENLDESLGKAVVEYAEKSEGTKEFKKTVPTKPGSYIVRVTFEAYVGYKEVISEAEFEIEKAEATYVVTIDGWVKGKEPKTPVVKANGNVIESGITFYYKMKDSEDETYIKDVPNEGGEYTVKAVIKDNDCYKDGECVTTFKILGIGTLGLNIKVKGDATESDLENNISFVVTGPSYPDGETISFSDNRVSKSSEGNYLIELENITEGEYTVSIDEDIDGYNQTSKYVYKSNYNEEASHDEIPESINVGIANNENVTLEFNLFYEELQTVTGTITWDDNDNNDGKRPDSVEVKLFANGTELKTVNASASEEWKYSFTDLPHYDSNNKEITYSVAFAEVDSYTEKVSGNNVSYYHILDYIDDITATVVWDDGNNQDGKRPESVKISLSGTTNSEVSVYEDAEGNWTHTFSKLLKYNKGLEVSYMLDAQTVTDYTVSIAEDNTITYYHKPGKVNVSGDIIWDDNDNQDGVRPENATIKLYVNNVDSGKTVTTNSSKEWKYSFGSLDEYTNGVLNSYSIELVAGTDGVDTDKYTVSYEGNDITLKHTPEETEVSGGIIWDDNDDELGVRPASEVTVKLYADGVFVKDTKAEKVNAWTYSFKKLPKYNKGVKITYTVSNEVQYYTSTYTGYLITNYHIVTDGSGSVEIDNWTYGQEPNTPRISTSTNNAKDVLVYYREDEEGTAEETEVPTDAGKYKIRVVFNKTAYYRACEAEASFEIYKAEPEYQISMESFNYNDDPTSPVVTLGEKTIDPSKYTVYYKALDADDDAYTKDVPTYAGKYNVKASVAATKNYEEKEVVNSFEIKKINGEASISVVSWTYRDEPNDFEVSSTTNDTDYVILVKGENEEKFREYIPTEIGKYTAKVIYPESTNYLEASATCEFEIGRLESPSVIPDGYMEVPYTTTKVSEVSLPKDWSWSDADKDKELVVRTDTEVTAVYTGSDAAIYKETSTDVVIYRQECKHPSNRLSDILYTREGDKEPTCEEAGLGHKECLDCNFVRATGISTDPIGHDYGEWASDNKTTHSKVCANDKKHVITENHKWDDGDITKEATATEAGEYLYTCSVCGETKTEAFYSEEAINVTGVYIHQKTNVNILCGLCVETEIPVSELEFAWYACGDNGGWFLVSDWTAGNVWLDWTPEDNGAYVIVGKVRIKGDSSKKEWQGVTSGEFHKVLNVDKIKATCQIPNPNGSGYLIGIETYANPNNSYYFEMSILDCTLYAQGLDAWVYTTGKCKTEGTCLWTVWDPQYGYYWTLFRIYDEEGNLLDEVCYGFENI